MNEGVTTQEDDGAEAVAITPAPGNAVDFVHGLIAAGISVAHIEGVGWVSGEGKRPIRTRRWLARCGRLPTAAPS